VLRRRDGCAAQYQGKHAFKGTQDFKARNGIEFIDLRNPENQGKFPADGDTHTLKSKIRASAEDEYGPGTQGLVRHLAKTMDTPLQSRRNRYANAGDGGVFMGTDYLFLFDPSGCFDITIASAEKGYKGSNKDFFYQSHGDAIGDCELMVRKGICGCDMCLKRQYRQCLLRPQTGNHAVSFGPVRMKRILPKVECEASNTRVSRNLVSFCDSIRKGDNVIVRIAPADRSVNDNLSYFVARLLDNPYKLDKGGVYGTNQYNAGWHVAMIRWYEFDHEDGQGNHWYSHPISEQLMQCNSFVRSIRDKIVVEYDRNIKMYKLSQALDAKIEKYGTFSS